MRGRAGSARVGCEHGVMAWRPAIGVIVLVVWSALLLVWAAAATVWVAADTAIGPVVVTLSRNHGIHVGDVAAGLLFGGGVVTVIAATAGSQLAGWRRRARRARTTRPLGA